MFSNLKITLRNLRNNKIYTIINMVGLVIGIVSALYILLWIDNELSFDRFHKNRENIYYSVAYQAASNYYGDYWSGSPLMLGPLMKESIPEIDSYCRIYEYSGSVDFLLKEPDSNRSVSSDNIRIYAVDTSFFTIFSFEIIKGDKQTPLNDISSIVLSESMANSLFGSEEAIGRSVIDHLGRNYNVTGIFADMPSNSSIDYNAVIPFSVIEKEYGQDMGIWYLYNYQTFFMMQPGFDKQKNDSLMTKILYDKNGGLGTSITLFPLTATHLYYNNMSPKPLLKEFRLFSVIAVIILMMACINYVNLVTARSSKRVREITIRKLLAAKKRRLFIFFYNETLVLFTASLLISILTLLIAEPLLNQISGKELNINLLSPNSLLILLGTLVFISLVGGIYPAFVLTNKRSFVSGSITTERRRGNLVREFLVVVQFVAVIVLTMGTIVISRQIKYMKMKDVGYNTENIIYLYPPKQMRDNIKSIKSELTSNPDIIGTTTSNQQINRVSSYSEKKMDDGRFERFTMFNIDENTLEILGITLLAGDNFTGEMSDNTSFLINQSAARVLFPEGDPIGKELLYNGIKGVVIGLVADFNYRDLKSNIYPMIIMHQAKWYMGILYVKTNGNNASAINTLKEIWERYSPDTEFKYGTLKEDFNEDYRGDIRSGVLLNVFSIIALIIAFLGIFGLITYTAEKRSKEIGIRKVLGADVKSIVFMLSRMFIILYIISMIIAFPIAGIWLTKTLSQYAYHIEISAWLYVVTAISTFIIGALTIGYKALKIATLNPVNAIKEQ